MTLAKKIVNEIVRDIEDRSGLGNIWDELDYDIQLEIREKWEEIVNEELQFAFAKILGR